LADQDEPSSRLVLKEINGYHAAGPVAKAGVAGVLARRLHRPVLDQRGPSLKEAAPLTSFGELKDDGSTASGAWIYTGIFAGGKNHAADRKGDDWWRWAGAFPGRESPPDVQQGLGRPGRRPWAKEARLAREHGPRGSGRTSAAPRLRLLGSAEEELGGCRRADFVLTKAPDTKANPKGVGLAFHDGASPFIMKADGKGWLYVPNAWSTGRLPGPTTSRTNRRSKNVVYPKQQRNPVALNWEPEKQPGPGRLAGVSARPFDVSADGAPPERDESRWLPWLTELMPELFLRDLAGARGGDRRRQHRLGTRSARRVARSGPKALVTRRIRPFRVGRQTGASRRAAVALGLQGHQHGRRGHNLTALVGDPNVSIHEAKVFVCNVSKG